MLLRLLVLLFLVSKSWAYNFTNDFKNGFYWSNLPISITVIDSDNARKAVLEQITRAAINEWESNTGLSIWTFTPSGSSPSTSNTIRWSTNFTAETGMDSGSVLAVAIRYSIGPYFTKTEIVINGQHNMNRNTQHLHTTLVHELGHTIGLDHSNQMQAVMAPTLQNPYNGLHSDDVQGMGAIYNETQHRQSIGFISPLVADSSKESSPVGLGCGTVQNVSNIGPNNLLSLLLGMLAGLINRSVRFLKRKLHSRAKPRKHTNTH